MADAVVVFEGWGSSTQSWGAGSWGNNVVVPGTTGAVGTVSVSGAATVQPTGLQATASVGSVTVVAEANIFPTGVAVTGAVGAVDVVADANVIVTGVVGTSALGSVDVTAAANIPVVQQNDIVGSVGTVTVVAEAVVEPTGVEATGATGTVTVTADAIVSPTGVEAVGATTVNYDGPAFTADGAAQLSTAQAKFGSASLLLDGTDDFVTSDENIDLSSGDFTVDMWIRPTSVTGYKGLWQSGTSSLLNVYLIGDQVQGTVAGSTTLFLSSTRISANVWTMISVEREGSVHRLYINGVLEASSSTGNRPDDGVFAVGKNGFGDFNGYIDETRLSTVARYGGTSFTEPTAAFSLDTDTTALLHFDGTNGSTDIINAAKDGIIVSADANIYPTGVSATSALGTVTTTGDAIIQPSGLEATGAMGTVFVAVGATLQVTGVNARGQVGNVVAKANADVLVTGVNATGAIGTVLVWGEVDDDQNPNWQNITSAQTPTWGNVSTGQTPNWQDIAA
jgi:hypothetical protein